MSAQLLIVMSDLHCGSKVGLSHPEAKQDSGNTIGHGDNLCQIWLWENWMRLRDGVADYCAGDEAIALLNGDATEGIHHRTTEVTAATIHEHAQNALQCLEDWRGLASRWLVTMGTECHTHAIEKDIAKELGSEARDKWLFRVNGCLIDAAHHVGTTKRSYLEGSAFGIEMGNARVNYARCNQEVPKVFLRGHRHCHGWFSDGHGAMGITGAWQFLTRHGKKVVTDSIPRPSILVLDWRGCKPGELPIAKEFVATPPQDEISNF